MIEDFCVTGTGMVYFVTNEFAEDDDYYGRQADLGSLDAPKRIAGGSSVAECWFGLRGQSTVEREAP